MSTTRPEPPSFVEHAPLRAVATRTIPAAPGRVFDALADAEGWERWFPGMRRCAWLTPAPHDVGSQREVQVGGLRVVERFTVWDRPHRWGFTFVEARPAIARAGVELVDLEPLRNGGATRVRYTMALEPPVPLGPLTVPVARALERRVGAGLAGLQRHVAGRGDGDRPPSARPR